VPVAVSIARGSSGLALPLGMRADAYKIATDEAWHAQFSYDLREQIVAATSVAAVDSRPQFIDRLDTIKQRLEADLRPVTDLMFAVVSETLISQILSGLPHDPRLAAAVREVVADHAADEGRHHVYFRDLLPFLWSAMDSRDRSAIGPRLPEMLFAFLEPDYRATAVALTVEGFAEAEVEQILHESYPREHVVAGVRDAASATLRYLAEVGALEDPATADAFAAAQLTGE
jgi:hypothetical protein